ncbi:MAG: hypothetical protein CMJ50_01810 [Planctomycetaceae bacterium]|nr:hypothetical protein [Planctomycetaceae bacterium]
MRQSYRPNAADGNRETFMMFAPWTLGRRLAVLVFVLLAGWLVPDLPAQEALRWKFSAGQTLRVSFRQTASTETAGAGARTTIAIVMGMEMTWRVEDVVADGTATMTQSFDRLTMSMKTGDIASVDYDSAAEPITTPAKEIAAAVGPLIGPKFHLTMNSRGEILDVKLPAAAQEAVAANTREGLKSFFSAEGISRVLRQSVVVFPEQPLVAGAEWKSTSDVASPLGTLKQISVYTYVGGSDRDGRMLEQIKVDSTLQIDPDAARAKTTIKSQSQTGELWFDRDLGRLVDSQILQKLTTVRPYRDTKIEVRSTSKLTMSIE